MLLIPAHVLIWSACLPSSPLPIYPGAPDYATASFVPVPHGRVNTAGGNLILELSVMSIDTVLGTFEIGAVYNSATGNWLWSFQTTYDGARFVDSTGYVVREAAPGSNAVSENGTLLGTHWVRVDATTIKTKGGLAHHFAPDGALSHLSLVTMPYPRIQIGPTAISQCTQPNGCIPLFEIELDDAGDPARITDVRSGRMAELGYDDLGRLIRARGPLDVEENATGIRLEYEGEGTLVRALTGSEGERIEYAFHEGGRISTVTRVGESNPQHRFDHSGRDPWTGLYETVHTNPLGGRTRYAHDAIGRLVEVELEGTGETVTMTYSDTSLEAAIRPATITTPSGATTTFTVSPDGDLTRTVTASGNVRTTTYEPDAVNVAEPWSRPPLRVEDSIGLVAQWTYGSDGRPIRIDLPENEFVELEYEGPVLASLRRSGSPETRFHTYGFHGHWLDASVPWNPYPIRRVFDPVGNLIAAAGLQEGGVLGRHYDASRKAARIDVAWTTAGRVVAEEAVTLRRRSDGQVLAIERPGGADHVFVYDDLGRLEARRERVDGVWRETTFEFDAAGNRTARERPNGMREEWEYDVYGRVIRYAALREGVLEGEALLVYEAGLLRSFEDSVRGVTEVYEYDAADRLQRITYSTGEWIEWTWDSRDRVREHVFSLPGDSPRTLSYEYDGANRQVRAVLDGSEMLAEYVYQDGQQVSVRYGNGLVRDAAYDPDTGQIAAFRTTHPILGVVEETEIERAAQSNPARYVISSTTMTPLATTTERYTLNATGSLSNPDRRVGARVWAWDDGADGTRQYAYDGLSNQVSNGSGATFVYDREGSRLLSASLAQEGRSADYAYDEAGFVIDRNGEAATWTATGRLRSFGLVSLEWDMAGRLISADGPTGSRDLTLFGGAVERDPQTGGMGSIELGIVRVSLSGSARIYRHQDFRGNTSFTSDEAGTVLSHHHYSAYALERVHGPMGAERGFAGRREIGDGLVPMGSRIYDSLAGRFWSPDPVFHPLNQYSYTLGDPVRFWDPGGAAAVTAPPTSAEIQAAFVQAAVDIALAGSGAVATFLSAHGGSVAATVSAAVATSVAASNALSSTNLALDLALRASYYPATPPKLAIILPPPPPPTPTCAPSRITAQPATGFALLLLIALQVGLSAATLVARRTSCGGEHPIGARSPTEDT